MVVGLTLVPALMMSQLQLEPGRAWVNTPVDVRSLARGAQAFGVDPAGMGRVDGFEFLASGRFSGDDDLGHRLGLASVVPLGALQLGFAYDWNQVPGMRHERGSVGTAFQVGRRVWLGAAYRWLRSAQPDLNGMGFWDVGGFFEPASWLTLSLGVDGLNAPRFGTERISPAYRVGAAVRPWLGEPWLSIGAETRLFDRSLPYQVSETRIAMSISPTPGLHALAAYDIDAKALWVGLSVAIGGLETRFLGAPPVVDGNGRGLSEGALNLLVRANPAETLLSPSKKEVEVAVRGDLVSRSPGLLQSGKAISTLTMELEKVAKDPSVERVVVSIGGLQVGLAQVAEVRQSIQNLRAAGKTVVAEISTADDKSYMIAAAADEIAMDPLGTLRLDGFSITLHYLADMLAKVGVRVESFEVGKHKSGPDTLTRNSPRPSDEANRAELLADALASLVSVLVQDRDLDAGRAHEVLSTGLFTAQAAMEAGLVDRLTQPDDPEEMPRLRRSRHAPSVSRYPSRYWSAPPIIKIIPIVGTMVLRSDDNILPGDAAVATRIVNQIDSARTDGDVAAVVLRVDTPGGDVMAAELIWRAVRSLSAVKPVVVSMGDVAASGGYYVAAPADLVLAQPNTITGSIGIYTLRPNLEGLFDMVGIRPHTFDSGYGVGWDNLGEPVTDEARRRVQGVLEAHYSAFVRRVAAGRKMELERAYELAEGRVYTGSRAMELGLVDGMGSLVDAVLEAQLRAGIAADERVTVSIPEVPGILGDILGTLTLAGQLRTDGSLPLQWLERWQQQVRQMANRPLAIMPFTLEVDP